MDAKGGRHVDSVELLRLAPFEEGKACQGEQGGVEEDAGHGLKDPATAEKVAQLPPPVPATLEAVARASGLL